MKTLKFLLFLAPFILINPQAEAKKVRIKYKLNSGQEFVLKHTSKQQVVQEIMGQNQEINNEIATRYKFKVLEINEDGNYLMQEVVEGYSLVMKNGIQDINHDSDSGEESPEELKFMDQTLNIPVTFIMKKNGEIDEILDAEEYIETLTEGLEAEGGPMQQMIKGIAAQSSTKDGLKMQLAMLFLKYPEGKIKTGEVWTDETSSTQMIAFKNIIENTLVSAGKGIATVKQVTNIEQMEVEGLEMEGFTMNYEMSGRKDGGYEIDLQTGIIKSHESATNISGVISMESPQMASPMSFPMTIKLSESIERME